VALRQSLGQDEAQAARAAAHRQTHNPHSKRSLLQLSTPCTVAHAKSFGYACLKPCLTRSYAVSTHLPCSMCCNMLHHPFPCAPLVDILGAIMKAILGGKMLNTKHSSQMHTILQSHQEQIDKAIK